MKRKFTFALLLAVVLAFSASAQVKQKMDNPSIDIGTYLRVAREAANYRWSHRVTEDAFIKMAAKEGTVILDARSSEKFNELHVNGAMNLSFPDISIESLARLLPDKNTRILIYCNNNFVGDPSAFAMKAPAASLNISTYISLYSYGYRNIYELGPLLDVKTTKIDLVRTVDVDR